VSVEAGRPRTFARRVGPPRVAALRQYVGFIPALLLFGVFLLVPLGAIVAYSFWKVVDYNVVHQFTFDNYDYFLRTSAYRSTAFATLWMSLATTAISIGLAFPVAYWLARHVRRAWQRPLLVLFIVPFWTSYLLRVYAWVAILGDKGAINRLLSWTGITDHPISLFLYARPGVILVLVYLYLPFALLTLYSSLERFDWEQLRAAMDLGASPIVALRRILIPQIKPGITTAVIFVFIPVLGEYLTPQIVGGTQGVMFGNAIANFFQNAEYTRGAAASLLVAGVIVALLFGFRRSLQIEDARGR
jgi:spermidine/putrescine transport system permease protein